MDPTDPLPSSSRPPGGARGDARGGKPAASARPARLTSGPPRSVGAPERYVKAPARCKSNNEYGTG